MALQNRLADIKDAYPNRPLRVKTLKQNPVNKRTKPFNTTLFNTSHWITFVEKFILDNNRVPHRVSATGVDLSHKILPNVNLSGARLKNTNFSFAIMTNANLSKADLRNSQIQNIRLFQANLENARLNHANLQNAYLANANLMSANLNHANLSHAQLKNADLSLASLKNADLTQANLIDANLMQANCQKANFSDANLRNACLISAKLNRANLKNTCLLNILANAMKARRADFSVTDRKVFYHVNYDISGDLRDAKLTGAVFYGRNLIDIALSYAKLRGAKLGNKTKLIGNHNSTITMGQCNNVSLTNADLRKARFNNTQLAAVDMTDAKTKGLTFKNVKVYSDSNVPQVTVSGSDVKTELPRSQWVDYTF